MVQFIYKGDQQHRSRCTARYGGLQYADIDEDNIIGELSHDCPVLYKMPDKRQRQKGLGYMYKLLAVYEGFDSMLDYANQAEELSVMCERDVDFHGRIVE